ncbi:hypothetical protein [Actinomadura madurae]|uniref:hypothetical protein n=1 Tax=Actinomadura madurae TaxID=1993 RepID=UPI0020D216DC|nr:hypothetical protein [Actinomadura madurae]MCP9955192.1 hypothetical protein [Actinomadura madurae]MCP9971926.1 hypothetical protein [Actinomadura madurae]MCP9984429.1 hypothetical protein [Actinomadura madurae]MCQ0004018.1 hypothetical protein [Actinomadura madurae]MCQ0020624.1 hypothetical protein [Actinomadura madurae]
MTDELDRVLRGTLATAADEAPAVPPGLLEQVEARHRGRMRRRVSATALAVAVVLGGTSAAGAMLRGDGPPATGPGKLKPVTAAELGTPVKVRDRWPDAVRSVPRSLPDGRPLSPIALLDGNRLLGTTTSASGSVDQAWAYDLKTGKADLVTRIDPPRGRKSFDAAVVAGDDHVAWVRALKSGGRTVTEIWTAPLAGGQARKVAEAGSRMPILLIEDRTVIWETEQGVYRASLAGGPAAKIAGSAGFRVVSWPWLGSPGTVADKAGSIRYRDLWNVRTGERRKAVLAPFKGSWSCGVTWCVGRPTDTAYRGKPMQNAVQRRDGKAGRLLLAEHLIDQNVIGDRFVLYRAPGSMSSKMTLYDLRSGKLLDIEIGKGFSMLRVGHTMVFAIGDRETKAIDLSAIR